jgi:nicotinamidase-related amidase
LLPKRNYLMARGVLLVHDVVNDFISDDDDPGLPAALANVSALVNAARKVALPIVFIGPGQGDPEILPMASEPGRLVWGSPGVDVPAHLGLQAGDTVIRKPRWGGFYGSALTDHLKSTGRDTLIVCGLSLAGGVETTVRDGYNRDLQAIIVADACLCRAIPDQGWGSVTSEEVAQVTLSILAQRSTRAGSPPFARIAATAEICGELEQYA